MSEKSLLYEYTSRIIKLILSLAVFALGMYIMIQNASLGMNAWLTFQYGIMLKTGVTVGQASIVVSIAIIIIDAVCKGKIGIGTLCNGIMVGWFTDIYAMIDFLPKSSGFIQGMIYLLIGQFINSVGMVLYMKAGLGCGPRDTLMVIVGNKLAKIPIGASKLAIEITVFVLGVLMGAPYGWGSVVATLSVSLIMQIVFKIFKFEPRNVVHENFADTYRRIKESKEKKMRDN